MYDINLKKGESYSFQLGGSGSAGYQWHYRFEGDSNIVKIRNEIIGQDGDPPSNYNMIEEFTLTAQNPGYVIIFFELKRSWESKEKPPFKTNIYKVKVKE